MSTTVNVICYKSKILKNGESPLMLRICKDERTSKSAFEGLSSWTSQASVARALKVMVCSIN